MTDFDKLVRLADKLYSRFEAQGNPSDLSLCVVHYRSALTLAKSSTTLSCDAQSKLLSNLASALSIRFQRHGDIADLDHSVECNLAALDLRPPGHPGRAKTLSHLAAALLFRYGQLGIQKDIELAIEHFHTALSFLPPDARLMPLMNYASALFSRFQRSGDISDLNDAIRQYRAVVDASPSEHKSASYYNLANALLSRFKIENEPKDLELSIQYSTTALQGMDQSHPDCYHALSCLSTALLRRFETYRNVEDLHTAVEHFESALELPATEDLPRYMAFYDLADALTIRYKVLLDPADLELAIEHYRTAHGLPTSKKTERVILSDLGNALFLRFSSLGCLNDLEEAIQKHYLALEIHSNSENLQPRAITLEALGMCINARFEQSGDPEDLDTAIDIFNEVLTETFQDHPHRVAVLTRSANCLESRFRLYGGVVDLDRSISYRREALELLAPDHPDPMTYATLASSLLLRFEATGKEIDLDTAYLYCNTHMNMQDPLRKPRPVYCLLLARILKARILPWEVGSIEPIFHHLHLAKDHCTLSYSLMPEIDAELALAHYLRFLVDQRTSDLHEAFALHDLSSVSLWPAFRASLQWVRHAEIYGHRSGIDVYRAALRLLDRHVLAARSPELRQCFARRYCASLAYNAAAFALRHQDLVEAIEVLEGGRSILWSQLVRSMTRLDDLRLTGAYGASLADDYDRLLSQLERASGVSKPNKDVKSLLREKEAIGEQIRRIEGFKSFLKATPFSDLEKAAIDGPVVVLIASQNTCDALVLLYDVPPVHVSLSSITPEDASQMAIRFRQLTENSGATEDDEALEQLLSDLWDVVAFPIFQQLIAHVPKGSRLWWCPTGVFTSMPLHAATPFRQNTPLSQIYVPSYTPTLQALIRTKVRVAHELQRSRRASIVPGFLKSKRSKQSLTGPATPAIIAIGHPSSDETIHELSHLRNRIPPSMAFRRMDGEEVSKEAVLAAFREPAWLHLACPVVLDTSIPYKSGFATRDGTVSFSDISKTSPRAEFAFLSAGCCRGEEGGLEETMHLAASLQYAGVRSVIGTLWPVDDEVVRRVTCAFYERVIPYTGGSMHYTNTAQSLNEVLTGIGNGIPFSQRIAFVHVGA